MEERILADLKRCYGLRCQQTAPVSGGWLNAKWRVSTDQGEVLVKRFSNERYDARKLRTVEAALRRQIVLEQSGVLCPKILPCQGRAIRLLDRDTAYTVMAYCPGKVEGPDTITNAQMESLGSACGRMHEAFARLPVLWAQGYPLDSGRQIAALWANHYARARACAAGTPPAYRQAVRAQEPILKQLTRAFLDRFPRQIAHEDFSADNILFHAKGVSAIVDFDRNHYSYAWHDVGRAILSLALKDNRLDVDTIRAFLEGYGRYRGLTLRDVPAILRLTWYVEAPWWIQPQFFTAERTKVTRFLSEMLWLMEHWEALDALMDS